MAEKKNDNSFALLALVAIVAIVAIVMMMTMSKSANVEKKGSTPVIVDAEGNLAG